MDIHHLRIFTTIYRLRSFSRASEALGISQPTISGHMKNLETELNVRLFDRVARTIIPTAHAELMYPRALEIIEAAQRLVQSVTSAEGAVRGQLVIGASTIPGTYLLPALAAALSHRYPDVSFEIRIADSREITNQVLRHELLVGVVGSAPSEDRLEYVPFMDDELILCASPSLTLPPLTPKGDLSPAKLQDLPIVLRQEGSGTRQAMQRAFETGGVDLHTLRCIAVLSSTDAVKQAVKAGLGLSVLSRVAVADELRSGSIREVAVRGLHMKRQFFLIRHKKRDLPPPYREFFQQAAGLMSTLQ